MFHAVTQFLFNLLLAIYAVVPGHDFGVAIIVLTILVRLVLWPLVTRQLHSQKAMQAMQPEVAKIREKAKGDKQKETEMLMELYKERGTNPFSSLLPLIVQIPIFLALYSVLRSSLVPAHIAQEAYTGVQHLGAISAIIHHTGTFKPSLFGIVDLTKPNIVLALVAGAAQFYQTRQLMPKKEHMDDQTRAMSGMTSLFPIITIVIGLTLPSALALYWTVTSLVAILQQHLVLERDARELDPALTTTVKKTGKA